MNNNTSSSTRTSYIKLFVFTIIIFALFHANICFAEPVDKGIIYKIHNEFMKNANTYLDEFRKISLSIFKIFLLISVALHGVRVALGRVEIAEALKDFILTLIFSAFCYVAIIHYEDWTSFIFKIEKNVAQKGLGVQYLSLEPINTAFDLWATALSHSGFLKFLSGEVFVIEILGLFIIFIMSLITARILVVMCESYLTMSIGVILLGFGSASFTRDYAIAAMKYVLSLVLKLLAMHLVIAVGISFIREMAKATEGEGWAYTLAYIAMASCILYVIQNSLAETIGGLVSGAHVGDGRGLASAFGAVRSGVMNTVGAVAAPVRVAGAIAAGIGAISKASKIASLEGHGGPKGTIRNLWQSYQEARQDEKRSGSTPSASGEARRMNAMMSDRYEAMQMQNNGADAGNPYSRGRTGNELANQNSADQRQNQFTDALNRNTAAIQAAYQASVSPDAGNRDVENAGSHATRTQQAATVQQKANSQGNPNTKTGKKPA